MPGSCGKAKARSAANTRTKEHEAHLYGPVSATHASGGIRSDLSLCSRSLVRLFTSFSLFFANASQSNRRPQDLTRAYFAHIGCPVVGDDLYSRSAKEFSRFGLLLLAARLGFTHPALEKKMEFELPEPDRFLEFARKATFY